ncbi:S49 family peptidase [Photobacterium angustum]|uniref:S49 family peptidase n=1 Tax=Photobacterium angustum TaxID=661 RepID=A0ABX5H243_PHOAN|nr:S49 family peptidase [Photobacterium angustum]PSX07013.1 S49 family peptidase [Photobacterium angustum]
MSSKLSKLTNEVSLLSNRLRRNTFMGFVKVVLMALMASVAIYQSYVLFIDGSQDKDKDHIAIIKLAGTIASGQKYGDGLSLSQAFHRATESKGSKAVIIQANSGGGAPVQAEIFNETLTTYLAKENHKPVFFIIEEVCASACMYIAAAITDNNLLAHKNSLVGSIGVKLETFGFVEAMRAVGVERRSYTIGDNKAFLDPFQPEDTIVKDHINNRLLSPLFDEFKSVILAGRGNKLSDDPRVLSGLVWTGSEAIKLGLIDDTTTSFRLRQKLSKQYDTDTFISYNKKASKITDLFKSEFWSDVIIRSASLQHSEAINLKY